VARGGAAAVPVLGAAVEAAVGEDPGGLVAEYGALRDEPPSRELGRQLGELIVTLLQEAGIDAAVRDRDQEPLLVVFRHEGRPYVMGIPCAAESDGPAAEEFAQAVHRSAAGASVILLSVTGFTTQAAGAASGGTVLWDRTHLEAVVCGLVTLPGLLEASSSAAFFGNTAYQRLDRLLASPDAAAPARMATPDRLPPP
jgi:hypothetical protein